MSCVAS